MSSNYTNNHSIPLSLAVWLASDFYDGKSSNQKHLSATSLLRSPRQIVLGQRVIGSEAQTDLMELVPSRMGTAIHDSIEKAWTESDLPKVLASLGYPPSVTENVKINPIPDSLLEDDIPIYMEQRAFKELNGWKISGKFDFVVEGQVQDFKSTGTYTYVKGSNEEKYRQQGSIYRWLNPGIITDDHMAIQFIFTNWSALQATVEKDKGYPQQRVMSQKIELMSLQETERFIGKKLTLIDSLASTPEEQLPMCTKEELWQDEPKYKYYKNPDKRTRSTKNFDSLIDANKRLTDDGNVGVVVPDYGQAKACKWCSALSICSQAKSLINNGNLIL